jgi:carboxymethylenebutenolidase
MAQAIRGQLTTLTVDDSPMRTYVALPEGDGPFPAVAVAQHRLGVESFMRGICDRLAEAGIAAAAPDLFHRTWTPEQFDEITAMKRGDERAEAVLPSMTGALRDEQIVRDMNAALAHLKEQPKVNASRLGVVGFCMGGRVAYLMATRNASLKSAACFYPGNVFGARGGGPSPFAASDRIEGAVIGFFGNLDGNPSPEDRERVDKELTRLKVEHEFHAYDGVGHAFMDPTNTTAYIPEVADDAWDKMLTFFRARLA